MAGGLTSKPDWNKWVCQYNLGDIFHHFLGFDLYERIGIGKPVTDIRKGIKNACKKARIDYGRFTRDGFVFHDLRHTFNTNIRKAGVPESVIMEITGHSTREMFDRYNKVDEEDTRDAIKQLENYFANVTQNVTKAKKIDSDN